MSREPRLSPIRRLLSTIARFGRDRRGNFAVIGGIMMIPLIVTVGFAIDGSRYYKARAHLQDAMDTAALAVAASEEQDTTKLKDQAKDFILSNLASETISGVEIGEFSSTSEDIVLDGSGYIETTFMRLANFERMEVSASTAAKRAPEQIVEVALVLDTTDSMGASDPKTGEQRIATLRRAASSLVETLLPEDEDQRGTTSIALVPYADHVNVGIANKNASWLQLNGEERTEPGHNDEVCTETTKTVPEYCASYNTEEYECNETEVRDGVTYPKKCYRNTTCRRQSTTQTTKSCTGSKKNSATFKFYGCVGTRASAQLRLSDVSPTVKYPAYVETRQNCAQPIIPLTRNRTDLLRSIGTLTNKPSNYIALTHIPSGLVWGLNTLSPTQPFEEGAEYDTRNKSPRKVLILMTDGDNTLHFSASNGKHTSFDPKTSSGQTRLNAVNSDTAALCTNIRNNKIEVYTIAFMVEKEVAKTLLRNCATSEAHYFDATDAAKLTAAFSGIARSISQVRIAR